MKITKNKMGIILGVVLCLIGFSSIVYANSLADRVAGKILLQTEKNGEAWYVNPDNGKRYFMGNPSDAFQLIRDLGIGISNKDLSQIPIAKDNADLNSTNNSQTITFKDNSDKTTRVDIKFADEQAILNGLGYKDLVLERMRSASGARYQSKDGKIVVWNKSDEVTIYKNDESVFSGTEDKADKEAVDTDAVTNLVDKTWVWQETVMNNNEKVTPKNPETFTLTFNKSGRVNGATDCNSFNGSYEVSDSEIEFGPFAMTKMYCENSQEQEFVDMVKKSNTVHFDDKDNLILLLPYDSGSIIFSAK